MKTIIEEGKLVRKATNTFIVHGYATIKTWDTTVANIDMESYEIEHNLEKEGEDKLIEKIKKDANDNGFGCEKIIAIVVDVYRKVEINFINNKGNVVYENYEDELIMPSRLIVLDKYEFESIEDPLIDFV